MEDTRTPLLPGTQLNFGEGKNVTIKELIGKGGNCLVYYASYCDNRKADHYVRIKECYPYNLPLKRETEGGLVVVHGKEREMIAAKERFFQAYDRNVTFQKLHGLVNSTGIVNELFDVNNTVYSMLSFVEGTDYGKYEDRTLKEALEHILAVAKVLKKYHEQGYLHLDIKPENIFVIPETAQHIQLFDFDSVVTTEELLEDSYLFSVSDGFAAPEQVQGRINKITPATDIYSLGATLFYKLFGRCVEAKDGMLNTALDFSNLVFKEEQGKYSVGLLKGLQTIFEKSIAVSPVIRWKEMDEFIQKLESLLPLADTERVTVKANFSYTSRYFVGREKQLEEMEAALNDYDVIVLSGIGGIGKTELAKKYAQLHKEEIEENGGRILFVPFTKSIRETICGNDIVIVNEGQNTEVKEAELFEARMRILREELTKEDLFILDNFDVEPDEDFELLREVGCKFILTSRCDFRDYNYRQIEVDQLGSEEEVYELFSAYNDKVYTDENRKALSELFWIIEYHTMTIELLAKHLRDTEEIPEVMLERLKEKEGITNIPDVTIRHLKDRKPRAESINRHLMFLFDLSVFTAKESESEAELMRSLSLLGYVRILKDSFLEYCNVKQKEEGLGHLIRTGWVEFDAETDKISLHQVILDLVYHHMNPTAENCPHLVEAMCMYMQAETETYVEKANRRRLVRNVLSRLQGDSVSYAKLCVLFGKAAYMEKAEQICLLNETLEAKDLLCRICIWKMEQEKQLNDLFDAEEQSLDDYFEDKLADILALAESAVQYARAYSEQPEYLAKMFVNVAQELDDVTESVGMYLTDNVNVEPREKIYVKIGELYEAAESLIMRSSLQNAEKEELWRAMRDFYGEDGYMHMYRQEHYQDLDKARHYQQLIDSVKERKEGVIDLTDSNEMDFETMAERAYQKQEYDKSLEYYERVLEEGERNYSDVMYDIARVHLATRNDKKAIDCLKKGIEWDRQRDYLDGYAYKKLINVYLRRKKKEEAVRYAKELISFFDAVPDAELDSYDITWLLFGYYQLYRLSETKDEQEKLWNECLFFFSMLEEEDDWSGVLVSFFIEYVNRQMSDGKVRKILTCSERFSNVSDEEVLLYALALCEKEKVVPEEQILVLLRLVKCMVERYPQRAGRALAYSKKAQTILEESCIRSEYLESKIYDGLINSLCARKNWNYEKRKRLEKHCNYFLIAETEAHGMKIKQKIKLWDWAVQSYYLADNVVMKTKCQEQLVELLEESGMSVYSDGEETDEFWRYYQEVVKLLDDYATLHEIDKLKALAIKGYRQLLEYHRQNREGSMIGDLEWNIYEIGGAFGDADCIEEAIVFFMVSNYANIVEKKDWNLMESVTRDIRSIPTPLLIEFRKAMQQDLLPEQIDRLSEKFAMIRELLGESEGAEEIKEVIAFFSKKYEEKELEFKRKDE